MDLAIILLPTSLGNLRGITVRLAADDPAILRTFPMAGSVYVAEKKWRKLISRPYVIVYRANTKRVWLKF